MHKEYILILLQKARKDYIKFKYKYQGSDLYKEN